MANGSKNDRYSVQALGLFVVCLAGLSTLGCSAFPVFSQVDAVNPFKLPAGHKGRPTLSDQEAFVRQWEAAQAEVLRGDYPAALNRLRELARRRPQDIEVQLFLADTLLAAGSPREALTVLAQAEKRAPNDARVHHLLGLCWDALGDPSQALFHHERALLLEPQDEVYLACYELLVLRSTSPGAFAPVPKENPL